MARPASSRSHRIPRVCRSSYAAELLGAEEAFDVGLLCRGFLASLRDKEVLGKLAEQSLATIPLTVVVDAKDVRDKGNSDTSSYGTQKFLAFTVAWLRSAVDVLEMDSNGEHVGRRGHEGHGPDSHEEHDEVW